MFGRGGVHCTYCAPMGSSGRSSAADSAMMKDVATPNAAARTRARAGEARSVSGICNASQAPSMAPSVFAIRSPSAASRPGMNCHCNASTENVTATAMATAVLQRPVSHRPANPSGANRITLSVKSTPPSEPQKTQNAGVASAADAGNSVITPISANAETNSAIAVGRLG